MISVGTRQRRLAAPVVVTPVARLMSLQIPMQAGYVFQGKIGRAFQASQVDRLKVAVAAIAKIHAILRFLLREYIVLLAAVGVAAIGAYAPPGRPGMPTKTAHELALALPVQ